MWVDPFWMLSYLSCQHREHWDRRWPSLTAYTYFHVRVPPFIFSYASPMKIMCGNLCATGRSSIFTNYVLVLMMLHYIRIFYSYKINFYFTTTYNLTKCPEKPMPMYQSKECRFKTQVLSRSCWIMICRPLTYKNHNIIAHLGKLHHWLQFKQKLPSASVLYLSISSTRLI